ncbi:MULTISPECIES: ABC transporter ATP-binding protein [Lactiplantibacillus]|uniref:ATP-binding cassette domain-containing protein n=1 Tax=Lactiplantibacillus pentosus TaxID=1589 RepID=A0AAW8WES9_LACPE|nr:ATP-binding cassette domain-containing protein [Lactiplantibacillus pentosus]MBU7482505.1 ATP-binding cassette domain-containing protein [Lactiplantibacillus sp. 30.2.29]MBU7459804.1 ATP-binding cassette domain-containing protein [Lactiplantibacillus pentosus]MBU7477859.1 ATP-binding cassette domain-containing protein [Lactiplantibacillus pentosus]MBU7485697.1 ATP-binding cassette domain-containing protein [Lactiplantibacillus pentosus]MBU7498661.1 ATP-binding cassette domain-containing pro
MTEAILSVTHLNKRFKRQPVLQDVTFDCEPGRIIGLVGANGAGKTTIMKSILGLIRTEGAVTIAGQAMQFDRHPALAQVGALIEYPSLYPYLSGWDNLRLFARDQDVAAQIQVLVTQFDMSNYIHRKARTYSLGMKQKLGIALAFLNHPQLVILDEPMNGLDPQGTKQLRDFIVAQKQQGVTLLISSHILGELQKLADDLVIIDHGRVIQRTTMAAALALTEHYVVVATEHDGQAKAALTAAGYQLAAGTPVKLLLAPDQSVADVLAMLQQQHITVTDVQHQDADLEQIVLTLLASSKA